MKFHFHKTMEGLNNVATAYDDDFRYTGFITHVSLDFYLEVAQRKPQPIEGVTDWYWCTEKIYYLKIKGPQLGKVLSASGPVDAIPLHEFLIAQKLYDLIRSEAP